MTTATMIQGEGITFFDQTGLNFGYLETHGSVIQHNATTIIATDNSIGWTFTGQNFADYNGNGWAGSGTLKSIEATTLGKSLYQFADLSIDMTVFRYFMDQNDPKGMGLLLFGGDDDLTGAEMNDAIYGFTGDDVIHGLDGRDLLVGGFGSDTITGGKGKDRFIIEGVTDSTSIHRDLITDLHNNDKLDLKRIDTNKLTETDDAFHIVADFTGGPGELKLTYDSVSDTTLIEGDTDGDEIANLVIQVNGDMTSYTHFIL